MVSVVMTLAAVDGEGMLKKKEEDETGPGKQSKKRIRKSSARPGTSDSKMARSRVMRSNCGSFESG